MTWTPLLIASLAACASRPDVYQPRHREPAGEIWNSHTVGQTFTARAPGVYRIDVFLATYARRNTGELIFHLRRSPADDQDLVAIRFDAADVTDNAYRSFTFPPLPGPAGQSYYFFFEAPSAQPGNAITVWYSPADAYGGGAVVLDGVPQPGDLHFRTYARYTLTQMLRDVARGLRRHWTTALLALLLFLAPGYTLLSLLAPHIASDLIQRLILGAGLSVALAPLLFLLASLVSLKLGPRPVILLLVLSVGYHASLTVYRLASRPRFASRGTQYAVHNTHHAPPTTHYPMSNTQYLVPLLLLLITILSLAVRFLIVQDLLTPMWGDSYHHTLIAQLLVNHGGLFTSWEPYVPLRTFTYHYGFHSLVALFHWLTGIPVLASVIVVGQILNTLAPLMVFPLVLRLGGNPWAGLIAVVIASLWSPMPMEYVNWGRYTQLTGMILLPVVAVLTVEVLDANRWRWRTGFMAAIALAGLVLSHYLVTLMYATFLLACLGCWTMTAWRGSRTPWVPWLRILGSGSMAVILVAPWLVRLSQGLLPQMLAARVAGGPQVSYFRTAYNLVGDVFAYAPPHLLALAVTGVVWGLVRRKQGTIVVTGWLLLLVLLANPHLVGLPGTGVVNNFTVLIALYLPLSVLAGHVPGEMAGWLDDRMGSGRIILVTAVLTAAVVGAGRRFDDLDYQYRLVTAEDLKAMRWIQENTAPDAKFLVNGFFAFGGHTVVGSDAGWWIPYLAERRSTVPPVTYTMEQRQQPGYVAQIEALYRQITDRPLDSPQTRRLLASEGVTHVYVGAVGGDLLDPRALEKSSYYRLVYHEGGVWIFETHF